MPAVSVIIPTYQHVAYVLRTLESVFAQSFSDYEVIVVNDGSPDRTAEVLRPLTAAGRIKYIEQSNSGQAAARNTGLRAARGEYIAFLDDDDLWPTDKLEWQVELIQRRPDVVAVGGLAQTIDSHDNYLPAFQDQAHPIAFESIFDGNPFVSPGQTLIRAQSLVSLGGFDTRIWGSDDLDLWFGLARIGLVLKEPRLALRYRIHSRNASRNVLRMYYNTLAVLQKHSSLAPPHARAALEKRGYRFLYRYAFSPLLAEAKRALRRGDWCPARTLFGPAIKLASVSLHDLKLMGWFARDLCPRRGQTAVRHST